MNRRTSCSSGQAACLHAAPTVGARKMARALEMASVVGRVPAVIVAVMMAVGMAVEGMAAVVILLVGMVPARRDTPARAAEKRKNDSSYASRGAEAPCVGRDVVRWLRGRRAGGQPGGSVHIRRGNGTWGGSPAGDRPDRGGQDREWGGAETVGQTVRRGCTISPRGARPSACRRPAGASTRPAANRQWTP